jgi:NAD(P)-dependent dehydrogenase (short-subunit alcohol dehydrogenase family)
MKTILITGVTGAVGEAAARAIARRGDVQLILAGRNAGRLTKLAGELSKGGVKTETVDVDLGDSSSVKRAVEQVRSTHQSLDAIVNIAAVYKAGRTTNAQGKETMMATNHLGPFTLTTGLLPLVKAASQGKVLTVAAPSSTQLNFEDFNYEKKFSSLNAFGASKMMNLLFAFRLADQFNDSRHASMAFHPGLIKSDLLKEGAPFVKWLFRMMSAKPEKAGEAIASLVLEGDPSRQNGKFYNSSLKEMKPASYATRKDVQEKLWNISEQLTN